MDQLKKSIEHKMFFIVAMLISSNAYFVQRVISRVDMTTQEVSSLREHVARIETKLEYISPTKPTKWKKL